LIVSPVDCTECRAREIAAWLAEKGLIKIEPLWFGFVVQMLNRSHVDAPLEMFPNVLIVIKYLELGFTLHSLQLDLHDEAGTFKRSK
jgi:hypothetical protein